ncbi:MAG: hypothetical protein LBE49_03070, partial [Deltaproteobacteria bacterium]|nr:hypothetical protein [Deltaproteobacteria bacterium]
MRILKLILIGAILSLALSGARPLSAQEAAPGGQPAPGFSEAQAREAHHLNTIGTYSAGFVLQSYGYIGVLADIFSQQIYDPDMVRSMLGETITYL